MKLSRKALISVFIMVVLLGSSVIAWTQFFGGASSTEVVAFETSMGNFEVQLDRQKAPITVDNFVKYVKTGFYDGTVFHRVMPGFVIQGGGFTTAGEEKATNAPIKLESNTGLKNLAGTIAMARTDAPNTATSQFFVNLIDNPDLDYTSANTGYAVFGKVVSGMDVVNMIAAVKTGTRSIFLPAYNKSYTFDDWPLQDVVVNRAYIKPQA